MLGLRVVHQGDQRLYNCVKRECWSAGRAVRSALCLTLVGLRSGLPVFGADDGQTDLPLLVDVWVVDLCFEADSRRLERILGWKVDLDPECPLRIWRIILFAPRNETKTEVSINRLHSMTCEKP